MTDSPRPDEPIPGVWQQWSKLPRPARIALVVIPVVVVAAALAADVTAGVAVAVLVVGIAVATVVFFKNRTDRLNAAMEAERKTRGGGRSA